MAGLFLMGERVQLRPLEEGDAPVLSGWINDPELRRCLLIRLPKSIRDEKEWIASMSTSTPTPRDIVLAIETRADARMIGTVGLHGIDWVQRRAMTGILLYPAEVRGQGYGTEAKNLILDYAFGELGMHSIWTNVFADNEASIRAVERQGYRRVGVFRQAVRVRGQWTDTIMFDILEDEWRAMRLAAPGQ